MHTLKMLITAWPRAVRARAHDASRKITPGPAGVFWIGYFLGVVLLAWVVG